MARDFQDAIEEFLTARMDAALQKLRADNSDHAARQREHETLYHAMRKAMTGQTAQTQQMFDDFLEQYGTLKDEESEFFYREGMSDAIRFLRFLQVL